MRRVVVYGMLAGIFLAAPLRGQLVDTTGSGWQLANLDLDLTIQPTQQRLFLRGDLRLQLTGHASSSRVVLALNSRDSTMAFDSATVVGGTLRALNAQVGGRAALRQTVIEISGPPKRKGETLVVRVYASSRSTTAQFTLAEDIALASWVTAWYPIPLPLRGAGLSSVTKAPGETRFDLPAGWHSVSNGVRVESRTEGGRTLERWATTQAVGRSFAAAPYRVISSEANGRPVWLFLLSVGEAEARVQASALARAIVALERRFGPYPTGGYAIAEVPEWVPGFLASSEQGFMMAKPETFAVEGGNIPLFAHEAAHGYWGNLVSSTGPGSAFLSESIAQYGAVIALEEMLGADAARDFLKFSREGYIPLQSARGYFEVVRRLSDSVPISELRDLDGLAKRIVVDSKGTWIYQMLRERMGDDRFFGALRAYLGSHADGSSTLAAFRAAMIAHAPDAGLELFFAQWLDRTGAPRLALTWSEAAGAVTVIVDQQQEGAPFSLDLELVVEGPATRRSIHTVHVDGKRSTFRLPVTGPVTSVVLDPDFKLLRWDEAYRTPPR